MPDETDQQYYQRRAQQELDRAKAATDRAAKGIHLNLAAEYAIRAERVGKPRAKLTLGFKEGQ